MHPSALTHFDRACAQYGEKAQWYASFLYRTDPLAEAVVETFAKMPNNEGWPLLNRALDRGIDTVPEAPSALLELFRSIDEVPPWIDWARIRLGGATFLRCRLASVVLACHSLPLVYSWPVGNKPLAFSGRLVNQASPRLKETIRFVLMTCQPEGLTRFGEGFKATVKVRLIHAQVRKLLRESGRWDTAAWGEPISQCHLSGTNLAFSAALLQGLRRLGYRFTADESEALMHLWRYSGYLSGIERELLHETEADGHRFLALMFAVEPEPDDDSRALAQGVMVAASSTLRHLPIEACCGVSEALIGKQRAARLGYPSTSWRFLVPALRPAVTAVELARQWNVPGVQALARVAGTQAMRYLMSERGLPGRARDFELPQQLQQVNDEITAAIRYSNGYLSRDLKKAPQRRDRRPE